MQRVFISFDYDNDEDLKNALVGQTKYPNSPFEMADWSVKEPLSGNWQAKVAERMKRTSVVAVMCGHRTHTAQGVALEVKIAQQLGKPYLQRAVEHQAGYRGGQDGGPGPDIMAAETRHQDGDN